MQAKEVASDAAKAEARAAVAALRAVEAGIAVYAERRDYLKLKDIAEASDVAGKVCSAEPMICWMFHRHLCTYDMFDVSLDMPTAMQPAAVAGWDALWTLNICISGPFLLRMADAANATVAGWEASVVDPQNKA